MLLTREEMTFDWGGARLDPVKDREMLGWMMNQFLYGEVTGIQCGHWLYAAPDVDAARFLARQAVEELQHVDNFLRIMGMLGVEPGPPHSMVRFLSTGMMPDDFTEHVCIEMAAGEGFVLMVFYAIIDTLDHEEITAILRRAVKQEERHVEFGERRTMMAIEDKPGLRRRLLGLNLVNLWGVRRLGRYMQKRMPPDHPVLSQLPAFIDKTVACHELRLRRMGLLDRPLAELGGLRRALLVSESYGAKGLEALGKLVSLPFRMLLPFLFKKRRLTDTYLRDPAVAAIPPKRDQGSERAPG